MGNPGGRRARLTIVAWRLGLFIAVALFWELATGGFGKAYKFLDPLIFGQPSGIWHSTVEYVFGEIFLRDLATTMTETFLGLVFGLLFGVILGAIFGYFRKLNEIFSPFLVALNSLPRPALAPLLVIWFGFGLASKVAVSFSLVFFIIFFNTLEGIKSLDHELVKYITTTGATRADKFRYLILPSVAYYIFAAIKISVSYAIIGAVVGEFVGAQAGFGYRILIATGVFETNRVYSILILLSILGVGLVKLAELLESRLLRWRPDHLRKF